MLRVRLTFNLDYMYCICESSCCLFLKPVTCYVGEFTVVTIRIRKVIQSRHLLGTLIMRPWGLAPIRRGVCLPTLVAPHTSPCAHDPH